MQNKIKTVGETTSELTERLNRRLVKPLHECIWDITPTEDGARLLTSQFNLLLSWWLSSIDTEERLKNLLKAEGVDFGDFVWASMFVLGKINQGKREFDFDKVEKFTQSPKYYDMIDGVAVQKHNKVLREYTLDFIDYMFACIAQTIAQTDRTDVLVWERYKSEEEE